MHDLEETRNKFFRGLKLDSHISDKDIKYLRKLYLFPKIIKILYDVTGRPVISNCGTHAEKISEFLDHHIKSIVQECWSYIKDNEEFLSKVKIWIKSLRILSR